MKKTEKTKFEDFLKKLFWKKPLTPELDPLAAGNKKPARPRSNDSFKNILNKLEPGGRRDFDDFSAFLWSKHFKRHRESFLPALRPKAAIRPYVENEFKLFYSPAAVLAGVLALALALSAGLAFFNPGLADRLTAATDKIVFSPWQYALCARSKDPYLCPAAKTAAVIVPAAQTPDANLLASYIVNNQDRLNKLKDGDSLPVKAEALDGRVAGVFEGSATEPSPELKQISEHGSKPPAVGQKAGKGILYRAAEAQKELVMKIQNFLLGAVF